MTASILTNTGAMIALQTLRATNTQLADVQGQISTGKRVANAKDNAAIFAISKTMQSDVKGFQAITSSLNLGASTIAVARSAAETVSDLLVDIKAKVVAAQEDNVDRAKIQADVVQLRDQINEVIGAAQFNGLNLVNNTTAVNILASLNRDSAGNVTSSDITVTGQDLSTTAGTPVAAVFDSLTTEGVNAAGDFAAQSLDPTGGTDNVFRFDLDSAVAPTAGNIYSVTVAGQEFTYTAQTGDDNNVVAFALRDSINSAAVGVTVAVTAATDPAATDVQVNVTNDGTAGIVVSTTATSAATGGLANLGNFDVSTAGGANTALGQIDTLIDTATAAAATFGSVEGRVDIQNTFVSKLVDSLKAGIGSLVDADLEEASARLQALQVQQQLGVQALSIANQAPQNILALFR